MVLAFLYWSSGEFLRFFYYYFFFKTFWHFCTGFPEEIIYVFGQFSFFFVFLKFLEVLYWFSGGNYLRFWPIFIFNFFYFLEALGILYGISGEKFHVFSKFKIFYFFCFLKVLGNFVLVFRRKFFPFFAKILIF